MHSSLRERSYLWGHQRRFNSFTEHLKKLFGGRVQKLSIDAGFTCPNRDGTLGQGGCSYCDNDAFNPSYCDPEKTITQQISEGIDFHINRYRRANHFLAYFQPYSNTYASLGKLKQLYGEALSHPQVAGLVIGTRPDCMDSEKLTFLREIAGHYYVMIEYGIESCYDQTLRRINRGHDFSQTVEAIEMTAAAGIPAGGHIILGLPGETKAMMLEEAEMLSRLPLQMIKLHQLQIFRNTQMEREYQQDPERFALFGLEEYIDFAIDFTEKLSPVIMIERFASEAPPRFLVAPQWGRIRYDEVLRRIERRLEERDTFQGKRF
ncbi:MAG: TIGR01212 family radical SAM protein [Bacteroidales bacterium]|nr:TIGR01212 family radical SAM protein [Lentimicrobiaceae bacterium]MDD5695793.1 TIGR01212 family radical SAM protein [Bacteroidales bacterium]